MARMTPCPCCGGTGLVSNDLLPVTSFNGRRLAPGAGLLLAYLLKKRGKLCRYGELMTALYGGRDDEPGSKILGVYLGRVIRPALDGTGLRVDVEWGLGYVLHGPEPAAELFAPVAPPRKAHRTRRPRAVSMVTFPLQRRSLDQVQGAAE